MAKLLSTVNWPNDDQDRPLYPVELHLDFKVDEQPAAIPGGINCQVAIICQQEADGPKKPLMQSSVQIVRRDVERLIGELKSLIQQRGLAHLTFVPITAGFELHLNRLSDEQYHVIAWQDMAEEFDNISAVADRGVRFTTNRARLLGFIRSLEADLEKVKTK